MDKEVKIARIGAISVIIASIIGGLFAVVPSAIENDELKEKNEELQAENLEITAQKNELQKIYEKHQIEYNNLNNNYISLQNKFEALEEDYETIIHNDDLNKNNEFIAEKDQIEIDEILETLYDFQDNDDNRLLFTNILTDIDTVELFYKTQICMKYYKYSNIIIAFKKYGIECEPVAVTEGILELWDIEMLYILSNTRKY